MIGITAAVVSPACHASLYVATGPPLAETPLP